MTALPPLTDGQWDDLRHRFPNHGTDVVVRISAGWCLARRDVDALRAAGVWCEHEPTECQPWCEHNGTVHECMSDCCDVAPEPAPVERFTTMRTTDAVLILDGDGMPNEAFTLERYGSLEDAQEAADAIVAILRRKHAKPKSGWQVSHSLGKYHLEHFDVLGHVNRRISFYDSQPHAKEALEAAASVLNGSGKPTQHAKSTPPDEGE